MTAPTITPEDQQIQTEQLVLEAVKLQAEAEAIKERLDTIKTILVNQRGAGTHTIGAHKVQIRAGVRRLNSSRLTAAYPADQYPQLYKSAIDTNAIKNQFAPAALEDFYDTGSPVVSFK